MTITPTRLDRELDEAKHVAVTVFTAFVDARIARGFQPKESIEEVDAKRDVDSAMASLDNILSLSRRYT